jgi:1,4-dihydroxy-2-naphthoyl-CoA hydrolase
MDSADKQAPSPHTADPGAPGVWRGLSHNGWIEVIGLELVVVTAREVVAQWSVEPRHHQPQGIVHGGVYASVVETCCSIGALLAAPAGKAVVGVENHTSFIRPVREGRLSARAVPLHAGRRAQLWECSITDAAQRLIATGRLRALCVDKEAEQER